MISISKMVCEMDLGDQMLLECQGKTIGLNESGRLIYLKIKEGRSLEEIKTYMEKLFCINYDYMNDIKLYVEQLNAYGIIEVGKNDK